MSTNVTDILKKSTAILVGAAGSEGGASNYAYGGYAFQADLSINFIAPSQLSVHFVSESGEYDVGALENRMFPGQGSVPTAKSKKMDKLRKLGKEIADSLEELANRIPFNSRGQRIYKNRDGIMPPARKRYEDALKELQDIQTQIVEEGGSLADIEDMGQVVIPTAGLAKNSGLSMSGGMVAADKITIGGTVFNAYPYKYTLTQNSSGHFLTIDYVDESVKEIDSKVVIVSGKYGQVTNHSSTANKRVIAIGGPYHRPGGGRAPGKGKKGKNAKNSSPPEYLYTPRQLFQALSVPGANSAPTEPLMDKEGNLRDVLQEVCSALGLLYYWDPFNQQIEVLDLKKGTVLNDIKQNIALAVNMPGVVSSTNSMTLEGTYSQGAAAYWARSGQEEVDKERLPLKRMNLLGLDLPACRTAVGADVSVGEGEEKEEGQVFNEADYCDGQREWQMVKMDNIRDKNKVTKEPKKRFKDYVRLLKASLIGPDFFKVYILNKKAGIGKFEDNADLWKKHMGTELDGGGSGGDDGDAGPPPDSGGATDKPTVDSPTSNVTSNSIVDELFISDSPNKVISEGQSSYTTGGDCLSIEKLDKNKLQTQQLYDAKEKDALANVGGVGGGKASAGQGPVDFFRIQKDGISDNIGTADDHIYNTLRGIAQHYGRYYYSPKPIKRGEWESMTITTEGNATWYPLDLDVKDTMLAGLYGSIDPEASARNQQGINNCIKKLKFKNPNNVMPNGKPWPEENTSNPSVGDFIQQVHGNTTTNKKFVHSPDIRITVGDGGKITSATAVNKGSDLGPDGTFEAQLMGQGSGGKVTYTVVNGVVDEVTVVDGGSGYHGDRGFNTGGGTGGSGPVLSSAKAANDHLPSTQEMDVFGRPQSEKDANGKVIFDGNTASITATNSSARDQALLDDCKQEEFEDIKGVVIMDLGPQTLVPENISPRIKRHINAFQTLNSNEKLNIVRYHLEAGYQIIQMAAVESLDTISSNKTAKMSIDKNQPGDELDYIVDQVTIGGLSLIGAEDDAVGQQIEGYTTKIGRYFEAGCIVPPEFENVMQTRLKILTPQPGSIGTGGTDCHPADPEAAEKLQKQQDAQVSSNMCAYASANTWAATNAQSNATITIVGEGLLDLDLAGGLESIKLVVDSNGPKTTYSIGTRRKQQVMNKLMDQDTWFATSPSFYNNVFSR